MPKGGEEAGTGERWETERTEKTESGQDELREPAVPVRPLRLSVLSVSSPHAHLRLSITTCASPPTPSTTPSWPTRSTSRGCSTSSATSCCRAGSRAARRRSGTTTCRTASARWTRCAQAILQALMDSGQLTPDMLKVLRGESTGDAEQDKEIERQLGELLDKIVQRLIDEGYLNVCQAPQVPQGYQSMFGPGGQARSAAQQVQFNLTEKGIDFLGYKTLKNLLGSVGKSSFGAHDTPYLATGVEAEGREQAVRVRRRAQPRRPGHAHQRDRPRGARRAAQHRVQRPHGEPERVPLERGHGADARLLALDDPLRRGPLHAGQEGRARAHPPDPHPVPGRQPPGGAVPRLRRGDPAQRAGHGAGRARTTPTPPRGSSSPAGSCWRRRRTCGRSS